MEMHSTLWILYALGAFLMFGLTNFLLKYASSKGVPPLEGAAILLLSTGLVGVIVTLLMIVKGAFSPIANPKLLSINYRYFVVPIVAGVFLAIGMYFLKVAVTLGKAAPATAIALSNALLVAVLSWLILGETLTLSEIVGIALYAIAIALLTLKPLG